MEIWFDIRLVFENGKVSVKRYNSQALEQALLDLGWSYEHICDIDSDDVEIENKDKYREALKEIRDRVSAVTHEYDVIAMKDDFSDYIHIPNTEETGSDYSKKLLTIVETIYENWKLYGLGYKDKLVDYTITEDRITIKEDK